MIKLQQLINMTTEVSMNIQNLFDELAALEQVESIALGGSRATGKNDDRSDYDVYLYVTAAVPEDARRTLLANYCKVMEIGNHYWEYEDNCTLNNGVDIDILYRNLDDFTAGIKSVVDEGNASNGYTTCMWHNLLSCKIIADKSGRLTKLKQDYTRPYPDKLRENIITKNRKLLSGVLPSYDYQIKKAESRDDFNSVNHRTAEFLASYFDIIFALNRLTHPGEKRLVSLCKQNCDILPRKFEENLSSLFKNMFSGNISPIIEDIIACLDEVLV